MITCQKNLLCGSDVFNEPDELSAHSEATTQGNKAFNAPDSAILSSLSPVLGLVPVLTLPSTKKLFKQFIQMYIKRV